MWSKTSAAEGRLEVEAPSVNHKGLSASMETHGGLCGTSPACIVSPRGAKAGFHRVQQKNSFASSEQCPRSWKCTITCVCCVQV